MKRGARHTFEDSRGRSTPMLGSYGSPCLSLVTLRFGPVPSHSLKRPARNRSNRPQSGSQDRVRVGSVFHELQAILNCPPSTIFSSCIVFRAARTRRENRPLARKLAGTIAEVVCMVNRNDFSNSVRLQCFLAETISCLRLITCARDRCHIRTETQAGTLISWVGSPRATLQISL